MKKWIIFLLCAGLLFLLSACSETGQQTMNSEQTSSQFREDTETEATMDQQDPSPTYQYRTEELPCEIDGQQIYGVAYIPETEEQVPLVIFSHELGSTHRSGVPYAEVLVSHGIATYVFDFRGGSTASRSDGSTVGMSAMTEEM